MTEKKTSIFAALEEKIAAIRAGNAENQLHPGEVLAFACAYHKNDGAYEPIDLKTLSRLIPNRNDDYFRDVIRDIVRGKSTRLPMPSAAFMANITGKDLEFWRRESYTLADAESIQITLPHETKPEPTIERPAIHSQGITPPTARDLAKAVLFPPDLNSTSIARIMKTGLGSKGDPRR